MAESQAHCDDYKHKKAGFCNGNIAELSTPYSPVRVLGYNAGGCDRYDLLELIKRHSLVS